MSKLQNQFLKDKFGIEKGNELYAQVIRAVEQNMKNHETESSFRKKVLQMAILPSISLFYLLQEQQNLSGEEACRLIEEFLWNYSAERSKAGYEKMAKMPFFFAMLKNMFSFTFRISGVWDVDIIEKNSRRFRFNINKCLWHDTCTYYKCPELCRIFCKSDEITYQGFAKKVEFKRNTMLAEDGNCCDFQFHKSQ